MAARPESRHVLEQHGMKFMPPREGIEHLVAELSSDSPEPEVLVINEGGQLDTDGTLLRSSRPVDPAVFRKASVPVEEAGFMKQTTAPSTPQPPQPAVRDTTAAASTIATDSQPLIDSIVPGREAGVYEATFVLHPDRDPFLLYHRFRGRPFLPGVIILESFAEASKLINPEGNFIGFSDVRLERGLALPDDKPVTTKVRLKTRDDGIQCELVAPFINSRGKQIEAERVYSSALVRFGETPSIDPIEPGTPLFGWAPFYYPQEILITHGPPMQSFKQLDYKHGGGRAQINAGSLVEVIGNRLPHRMLVASLALDGSMVGCGFWGYCMLEKQAGLPYGIKEYRQVRQPDYFEQCTMRFFYKESNSIGEVYDFILLGSAGDVVLKAEGYQTAAVVETE